MIGGGQWKSQNKILPGAYINFFSSVGSAMKKTTGGSSSGSGDIPETAGERFITKNAVIENGVAAIPLTSAIWWEQFKKTFAMNVYINTVKYELTEWQGDVVEGYYTTHNIDDSTKFYVVMYGNQMGIAQATNLEGAKVAVSMMFDDEG